MDARLRGTPDEDARATWRIGYRLRTIVVALAIVAAVASHLLLDPSEAASPVAEAAPIPSGAPQQFDHSVVLRQNARDDALHPGASIAAYWAP